MKTPAHGAPKRAHGAPWRAQRAPMARPGAPRRAYGAPMARQTKIDETLKIFLKLIKIDFQIQEFLKGRMSRDGTRK